MLTAHGVHSRAFQPQPHPHLHAHLPPAGAQVVEALAAHPQISCRGEVLNPIYEVYGDVRSRPWWRVRLHWRAMLLPTLPYAWGAAVRAVGVKLFHVHTKPGAFACGATLAPLLESLEPRPVLFLLYRRCLISCYLSLSRAFETNVWWSAADSAPVPTATTPSTASVSGLAQYCEQERRLWREVLAELASAGWRKGDLHLFCYEDDVSTADGWVRENALPDLMADGWRPPSEKWGLLVARRGGHVRPWRRSSGPAPTQAGWTERRRASCRGAASPSGSGGSCCCCSWATISRRRLCGLTCRRWSARRSADEEGQASALMYVRELAPKMRRGPQRLAESCADVSPCSLVRPPVFARGFCATSNRAHGQPTTSAGRRDGTPGALRRKEKTAQFLR